MLDTRVAHQSLDQNDLIIGAGGNKQPRPAVPT